MPDKYNESIANYIYGSILKLWKKEQNTFKFVTKTQDIYTFERRKNA